MFMDVGWESISELQLTAYKAVFTTRDTASLSLHTVISFHTVSGGQWKVRSPLLTTNVPGF